MVDRTVVVMVAWSVDLLVPWWEVILVVPMAAWSVACSVDVMVAW